MQEIIAKNTDLRYSSDTKYAHAFASSNFSYIRVLLARNAHSSSPVNLLPSSVIHSPMPNRLKIPLAFTSQPRDDLQLFCHTSHQLLLASRRRSCRARLQRSVTHLSSSECNFHSNHGNSREMHHTHRQSTANNACALAHTQWVIQRTRRTVSRNSSTLFLHSCNLEMYAQNPSKCAAGKRCVIYVRVFVPSIANTTCAGRVEWVKTEWCCKRVYIGLLGLAWAKKMLVR